MRNEQILERWLDHSDRLTSVRTSGVWQPYGGIWQEITLPFTTLTHKPVRIFIQRSLLGNLILTDQNDLSENAYGVKSGTSAYDAAKSLLERDIKKRRALGNEVFYSRGTVWCDIKKDSLLGSRLFEMGQLLQMAVNLAVLEHEGWGPQAVAEGSGKMKGRQN